MQLVWFSRSKQRRNTPTTTSIQQDPLGINIGMARTKNLPFLPPVKGPNAQYSLTRYTDLRLSYYNIGQGT